MVALHDRVCGPLCVTSYVPICLDMRFNKGLTKINLTQGSDRVGHSFLGRMWHLQLRKHWQPPLGGNPLPNCWPGFVLQFFQNFKGKCEHCIKPKTIMFIHLLYMQGNESPYLPSNAHYFSTRLTSSYGIKKCFCNCQLLIDYKWSCSSEYSSVVVISSDKPTTKMFHFI